MSGLFVGFAVLTPQFVLAADLPQCTIELRDGAEVKTTVVELNLQTYPQSDLAAYAFHGNIGGFNLSLSTSDGHYIAAVTSQTGTQSFSESDSGIDLSVSSAKQQISIVCP